MYRFATENQTTYPINSGFRCWVFTVYKRWKKPTAEKSTTENLRRNRPNSIMEKWLFKWLFKWTVTFRDGAHAVVVHRKHASAIKLPSCSVKRNPNLVSMLLRNRYRLCVGGGGLRGWGGTIRKSLIWGNQFWKCTKDRGIALYVKVVKL